MYKTLHKPNTTNRSRERAHEQENGQGVMQRNENRTGLPDRLKQGMESFSGMDLSDVRVRYNSEKPAQLNAHAYTKGSEIHMAPGRAKDLSRELGHVVQQRLGMVQPTMQYAGQAINDDAGLERQATSWGETAMSIGGGIAGEGNG